MPYLKPHFIDHLKDFKVSFTRDQIKYWFMNPRFWLATIVFVAATIPQYNESIGIPNHFFPWRLIAFERYTVERIFYLLPIGYSAITIGVRTGMFFSFASLACMLPRVLIISPSLFDPLFESLMVVALGLFFCLFRNVQINMRNQKEWDLIKLKESRKRIVNIQESLRKDIAQEIHGTVQSRLIVLLHRLKEVEQEISSKEAVDKLCYIDNELMNLIENHIRPISHRLYPSILRRGLVTAIQSLGDQFESVLQIDINIEETLIVEEKRNSKIIPEETKLATYRVIEEALNNVVKHAAATKAIINARWKMDDTIEIVIEDNGRGFDINRIPSGLGLAIMQDYIKLVGGIFNIKSTLNTGTKIQAILPVVAPSTTNQGIN